MVKDRVCKRFSGNNDFPLNFFTTAIDLGLLTTCGLGPGAGSERLEPESVAISVFCSLPYAI
jgi:hypothetical protein